jgi:hypothetical protein
MLINNVEIEREVRTCSNLFFPTFMFIGNDFFIETVFTKKKHNYVNYKNWNQI